MYSMLTPLPSKQLQQLGQPAGTVRHFDGHHLGDVDHVAGLLEQLPRPFCQSETISRRMPNCCVSASDSVRMLMPALGQQAARLDHLAGLVFEEERELMDLHGCSSAGSSGR